jgi:hypothetical protein|tara:strand:+ start:1735 stop:3660 length:1926 start_codon:yes stop_codon:yes gene_type:complete
MVHKAERLPVTLTIGSKEHKYNIEVDQYRRTAVPLLREQRDTSNEAGEQSINNQFWLRSQTSWELGAGQTYFDKAKSDRSRFNTSSGVDVWTEGQFSLLPLCETKNNALSLTAVIMKIFRKSSNDTDYMYVASGSTLYYSSNFSAADGSVTWATVSAPASGSASTINDIASDGTNVYIAYGSARVPTEQTLGVTTAPTNFGSLNPDYFDVVSGRLFAIDGKNVSEYDSAGAKVSSSMDSTLYDGEWLSVASGPAGFYIASNTAGTGVISFAKIGNTDGLLQEAQQVAELPRGEKINEMISYGGFLVLATSKGLRIATTEPTAGGVTYGPVINDAGEAYSLVADERFVWFGGSSGKVYRADLSKFTETLVPAWSPDLVSVGDGNSLSNVTYLARSDGKTYFVDAGNGVQGQQYQGNLVASGTLNVGDIRWNTEFDKVLRTIELRRQPDSLTSAVRTWGDANVAWADSDEFWVGQTASVGGSVTATVTNDNNNSVTTGALANKVKVNVEAADGTELIPTLSESFRLKFNLTRDGTTATAGPIVESWRVEAFAAPTRVDEIVLPIILKSRVATSRGMGSAAGYNTKEEYEALNTAMVNKQIVTYNEGSRSENVVIDQIQMAAEKLADDGTWWEGVCTLRLLTVP